MFAAKCLPRTDPHNQWSYCPSLAVAFIFALLFLVTTLAHIFQAFRHRQLFCLVIITGAVWETAAFAFRVLSARHPTHKASYDASFLLILLAPVCINAFAYMIVSRLVRQFLGRSRVFGMQGRWMGKVFVCCDMISFLVQIGGGLLSLSHKATTAKHGVHIVTAGVLFQELLIVFFFCLSVSASLKISTILPRGSVTLRTAKRQIHVVQASLALITYRIVYRIVEFASGQGSSVNTYITNHEWCVYVFDAGPMFIALLLMNFWHPGCILVRQESHKAYEVAMDRY